MYVVNPFRRSRISTPALVLSAILVVGSCSIGGNSSANCLQIDMAVSSEKYALMTDLAAEFNDSTSAKKVVDGGCGSIAIQKKSSGAGATALSNGWTDERSDGPRPVIWSPASSAWGAVVNQRLSEQGKSAIAPESKPFMLTPLVIAMPEPMAKALGWPNTPIGYGDILRLAQDPQGWGSLGHPEWGAFRLGKTNPNYSTSALSATIAQYYAATNKTSGLSIEDLAKPEVVAFAQGVEDSVVHYGDITMTFLNNWYRTDSLGTSLTYVSAVAVEEKSVVDYNQGNPDGELAAGEVPRKPKIPLVAIYPKEGTLYSDNPFIILDADWVSPQDKLIASAFEDFVLSESSQKRVLEYGFRPGNPSVAITSPIDTSNGVDPNQPQNLLDLPKPDVLVEIINQWEQHRKGARVMLVLDVSGSMGSPIGSGSDSKLDLAKQAAIDALDQFKPQDQVGLRVFTTGISPQEPSDYVDLVPIGTISSQRETMIEKIRSLVPLNGTPLFTVTGDSYDLMKSSYDPKVINAVVLLTDGMNDDDRNNDLDGLLNQLSKGQEGSGASPIRIFTIAYGDDADLATLEQISQATNAATYNATDPASIRKVFVSVLSNF